MQYEQEARIHLSMEDQIRNLEILLESMQSDFAKCAKDNISPCHYCANDEKCNGCPETCNFIWMKHI